MDCAEVVASDAFPPGRGYVHFCYLHNRKTLDNTLALGFTQEGILRNYIYDNRGRQFLSVYLSSMLAADYRNNARLKKLAARLLPARP